MDFKKSGENSFVLLPDYLTNYIIMLFQAGSAARTNLSKSGNLVENEEVVVMKKRKFIIKVLNRLIIVLIILTIMLVIIKTDTYPLN